MRAVLLQMVTLRILELRRPLGIEEVFSFVDPTKPLKEIQPVIDALANLVNSHRLIKIDIPGGTPEFDLPALDHLARL